MERIAPMFILTALATLLSLTPPPHAQEVGGLAVAEVMPVRGGVPARLCTGDNALRVTLTWPAAAPPPRSASLRLALVLPGGPPAGTLIAEGSASTSPGGGATSTTFTFLHVEVPERLRGRGAQLVVRVSADGPSPGAERALPVDVVTDWSCRGGG